MEKGKLRESVDMRSDGTRFIAAVQNIYSFEYSYFWQTPRRPTCLGGSLVENSSDRLEV